MNGKSNSTFQFSTIFHYTHIWRKDLHPSRRFVRSTVLEAKCHRFLVAFPAGNGVPLQFHGLCLEGTILPAGVQPEALHTDSRHHVAFLAAVASTVREHDVSVAGQGSRQRQIFVGLLRVLQCFQLVETAFGPDVTPVHFVHGLK